MRARRLRRLFSYLLMSGGALFLFLGARDVVESNLGQRGAQHEFQVSSDLKPSPFSPHDETTSPSSPAAHPQLGDAIAKMTIPRLQTALYVVEGDSDRELRRGPGHVQGTVMPGGDGNCLIAGHRDTHFRVLKDIRKGDEIVLQTRGGEYTYRVESTQIVSPQNTRSLRPSRNAELHLITCYPFYYLGSAPKRFIVEAQLESTAETSVAMSENPSLANSRTATPLK